MSIPRVLLFTRRLTRECLGRRIPTGEALAAELAAHERRRNRAAEPIRWQFTAEKARVKLHRLYPNAS